MAYLLLLLYLGDLLRIFKTMKSKYLLLFLFGMISMLGFSQFRFNEYSCANVGAVLDPLGSGYSTSPDWVELINIYPTQQNLSGWYISDDRQNLFKYQIPLYNNAPIKLDSFNVQVIFLCQHNKSVSNPGGVNATSTKIDLHANFQLNQTQSPWLYLTKVNGLRPSDSVQIQRNKPDHSWGKPNSDSAAYYVPEHGLVDTAFNQNAVLWSLYPVPSAGKKNPKNPYPLLSSSTRKWYKGYAPTPKFMTKPGYYTTAALSNFTITDTTNQSLTLHKDSLEIFATSDCSAPVPVVYGSTASFPTVDIGHQTGNTSLPIGPLPYSQVPIGLVVRAINHDQSTPPKYLDSFEAYGAYVLDSTYHMSVFCACIDTNTLFMAKSKDTVSAIYSYLTNRMVGNAELAKNQGQALIKKIDFLNKTGATTAKMQWQFLFRSEDEYGYNYTNKYDFFTDPTLGLTARADYPELVLRSGSEDNFLKGGHYSTHLRDFFNHTMTLRHKLNFESSHYVPTYMFINGINRGIYYVKEPIDSTYIKYYYNHNQSDIIANDLIPTTTTPRLVALSGNLGHWSSFYNWVMSNGVNVHVPAIYQMISDSLDFQSFCDYNFYNMYSVNTDFVKRQALWWRGVRSDTSDHSAHKWRFGLSNTDLTWGFGNNYTGIITNSVTTSPCDYIDAFGPAPSPSYPLVPLLYKLMGNDTFLSAFLGRYQDLINTSYSCDSLTTHLKYVSSLIAKDMTSQVWWNANPGTTCGSCDSVKLWNAWVDSMSVFMTQRCTLALQGLVQNSNCSHQFDGPYNLCIQVSPSNAGYVVFNSITIKNFVWNGKYIDSVLYAAKAIPDSNYVFDHWETPYPMRPGAGNDSVNFYVNKDGCITAVFKIKPANETYGTPMLPSAFSPNGDGNDDIMNIYGIANASSYEFEVYNRWGEQVFLSHDKSQGWDGTYNGVAAPVGVYGYYYNIVISGKTYSKKGSFTLLR